MYSNVWDEIINNGKLDQFNEDNFDTNITLIMIPENIVGIEVAKDFYANYLTSFSDIKFTVKNIFGQDDIFRQNCNWISRRMVLGLWIQLHLVNLIIDQVK